MARAAQSTKAGPLEMGAGKVWTKSANDEIAKCTGSSSRTVKRDWAFARAFLIRLVDPT